MPLIHKLRKCTGGCKLHKSQEKINHLDDIKLFPKNENELKTLIQAVTIYTDDIKMKFGIENCANKEKRKMANDGSNITSKSRKIRILTEKEAYKYFEKLEADTINQAEMKEKIKQEYLRRTRKQLVTKLYGRNLIKGIKTYSVHLVRNTWSFLKWTKEELQQTDMRTRKVMTKHPRDYINRLYMSRKGRGIHSLALKIALIHR